VSIFSHIKGAISGFARGGFSGAISGAIAGQNNAPNPKKAAKLAARARVAPKAPTAAVMPGGSYVSQAVTGIASVLPSASQVVNTVKSTGMSIASTLLGSGARTLPTLAKIGTVATRAAPVVGTAVLAGQMLYDAFGNPVRRRRRRMNPLNQRAARCAIRRVRAVRKMLQSSERQLPKQRVTSRSSGASRGRAIQLIKQE